MTVDELVNQLLILQMKGKGSYEALVENEYQNGYISTIVDLVDIRVEVAEAEKTVILARG